MQKSITTFVLGATVLTSFLAAEQTEPGFAPQAPFSPWFTGTLLSPIGEALTKGHFSFQPYFFANTATGFYHSHWNPKSTPNVHNETLQLWILVGLTDFMDIIIIPEVLHTHTQGQSSTRFGDLPIELDFQLIKEDQFQYVPGIKLGLIETFPTGKYQKLNPKKLETDVGGLGSFATTAQIVFYKICPIVRHHYLSITASFAYTYFAPVHVKGFNVFGGASNTRGKVFPGNASNAILSFQYSLTQNWVLALDNSYLHVDKDRFRGRETAGRHSSELISFAPAIEYNFSANLGLIAGVWFSAAGRNTPQFTNGVISFVAQY
jgi:hypothetical protein